MSFANLDCRFASRGRKSPFVVLSSWVCCFVIIKVTTPYIGSAFSVIRSVMSTYLAFNCEIRNYPFVKHLLNFLVMLHLNNLGREQRCVAAILGFPNV